MSGEHDILSAAHNEGFKEGIEEGIKQEKCRQVELEGIKEKYDALCDKLVEARELVWDKFPENQGEMVGCPYSVLCYLIDYTNSLKKDKQI